MNGVGRLKPARCANHNLNFNVQSASPSRNQLNSLGIAHREKRRQQQSHHRHRHGTTLRDHKVALCSLHSMYVMRCVLSHGKLYVSATAVNLFFVRCSSQANVPFAESDPFWAFLSEITKSAFGLKYAFREGSKKNGENTS